MWLGTCSRVGCRKPIKSGSPSEKGREVSVAGRSGSRRRTAGPLAPRVTERSRETYMDGELLAVVKECTGQIAREEGIVLPEPVSERMVLFGAHGPFDSIGLVSLVVIVEERVEDRYGVSISLADERAMSQERSPFRSVGALAQYAYGLIEEKKWEKTAKTE